MIFCTHLLKIRDSNLFARKKCQDFDLSTSNLSVKNHFL